jgi:hypothetical protein
MNIDLQAGYILYTLTSHTPTYYMARMKYEQNLALRIYFKNKSTVNFNF